jgi:regulator-associated protein of mTOR
VHPESIPAIPSSTSHALWTHWDLILDNLFEQLPAYFDDGSDDGDWEANLKLVSFVADQLESVLTSDQAIGPEPLRSGYSAGLARLPIICKAAQTEEFRERATTALDTCLQALDIHGLAHAVQGGALDVAAQLLLLEDSKIAPQMISIWASLVRHDACVMSLAAEGRTAERLTSVPCVRFFLDSLENHLDDTNANATRTVIQTAAVLSTIANYVAGRAAPRFVARTLRLSSTMLKSEAVLVQQWGALLIAEVIGSISLDKSDNVDIIESLKTQLLELIRSESVESRATAVYALTRWISAEAVKDVTGLDHALQLVLEIIHHARADGSALVRKELVRLFQRVLQAGGAWTTLTFWVYMMQQVMQVSLEERSACNEAIRAVGRASEIAPEQQRYLHQLDTIIRTYEVLRLDPDVRVAELVMSHLRLLTGEFRNYVAKGQWDGIFSAVFPDVPNVASWTPDQCDAIRGAGLKLVEGWSKYVANSSTKGTTAFNNELFEKSKLSLQAYLGVGHAVSHLTSLMRSRPSTILL